MVASFGDESNACSAGEVRVAKKRRAPADVEAKVVSGQVPRTRTGAGSDWHTGAGSERRAG